MRFAALRVLYAPFLLIVRIALVETRTRMLFDNSGTKIFFDWRFTCFRFLPVGLN